MYEECLQKNLESVSSEPELTHAANLMPLDGNGVGAFRVVNLNLR